MRTSRTLAWAMVAALGTTCALITGPAFGEVPVERVIVHPGQAPLLAIEIGKMQTRAVALRKQWLASGHTVAQATASGSPAITGGTVKREKLTVGDPSAYPHIILSYSAGTAGYNSTDLVFAAPSGQSTYGTHNFLPFYTQSGTQRFASVFPLNLWAQPGKWTLAAAAVYDNAGNVTTYNANQLAALFTNTYFRVENSGVWDGHAPKIKSGKLVNDTVSLSATYPVLKARIAASDTGSGIYVAYVFIQPPGQTYSYANIIPNAMPIRDGAIKAYNPLNQYSPTGTWGITGYGICDFAGNCSGSSNQSDVLALFGADSFTVTP